MSAIPSIILRVCADHLREIFREQHIQAMIDAGKLTPTLRRDQEIDKTVRGQQCVKSQIISWLDGENNEVMRSHQYVTAGGEIGASGMTDPKRIQIGSIVYGFVGEGCVICDGTASKPDSKQP